MRPFEIVLLVSLASWIVAWWRRPARRDGDDAVAARWTPPAMVVVAIVAQLVFEGARWNLAGLYAFALAVLAVEALAAVRSERRRGVSAAWRGAVSAAAGVGIVLLALPPVVLPVPNLPPPSGPWPVGTTSIEYRLSSEPGPTAPDGSDGSAASAEQAVPVRVRARLWYPAPKTVAARPSEPAPWLEHVDAMLPALGARAGLPAWALGHLEHTRVQAVWDAPLGGDGPLAIVTFDHGRGGFAAQNTFLAEELASQGWLVVAPEHPGGAVLTVFDDGSRTPFDPASFGEGLEGAAYADAIRRLGRRWADETAAAIDALASGAGPAGLAERLDRDRLVASGHSTGGGSAFALCELEPGCRAVVGLDPWMLPVPAEMIERSAGTDAGAEVPGVPDAPDRIPDGGSEGALPPSVLALFSDLSLGFFEPANLAAFERLAVTVEGAGGDARYEVYDGAGHMDFADVGLLSPLADRLGLYVGPTPPRELLPRIRRDVVGLVRTSFAND